MYLYVRYINESELYSNNIYVTRSEYIIMYSTA